MKLFSLLIFLLVSWSSADVLMKYGPHLLERGLSSDQVLTNTDDGHVSLQLKTPFIIDGEKFHTVFINVDGLVTFEGASSSFEPTKVEGPYFAPFWGDVDLTGELEDGNMVHYRVSENEEDLDWVRVSVQEVAGSSVDWRPTTVVVATWDRVGHFMSRTDLLNTFQVVLATDGKESYGFSNYPQDGINWWVSEQGQGARAGYRTRNVEHTIDQSELAFMIRQGSNNSLARTVGGRMVKFDGEKALLSEFVEQADPCFFGGSSLSVHGFGFQHSSSSPDLLVCRFSTSQTQHLLTSATFVSSEEIRCEVPAMSPHQRTNVSVSINGGQTWSEPVTVVMSDCILSYVPVETCISKNSQSLRVQEQSILTVESFPEPWNPSVQYSCKFGQVEVEGSLDKDSLSCPVPDFGSPQSVELKVVVKDGARKLESRKFGKLTVTDCSFILNKMEACGSSRRVVLISQQDGEKKGFGAKTGVLEEPSGKKSEVKVEGKLVNLKVPVDGEYLLTLDNGRQLSFEINC